MDVMDRIAEVKTGSQGPFRRDAPLVPIEIYSITQIKEESAEKAE